MEEKVIRKNLVNHLISKQLSYVNKTIDDIKDDELWYQTNTLTEDQFSEWKEYCLKTIKKTIKCTKEAANKEFMWFNLQFGLKVENNE